MHQPVRSADLTGVSPAGARTGRLGISRSPDHGADRGLGPARTARPAPSPGGMARPTAIRDRLALRRINAGPAAVGQDRRAGRTAAMKILIAYATTEGQTRKIARACADRLADAGHAVELLPAADADDVEVSRFDAAILAGSLHAERYQRPLVHLAHNHAAALASRPTLFLSVSLSAAGTSPEDLAGLDRALAAFVAETGWTPDRVEQVAGAFRFGEYDFFKAWVMRRIAAERGETVAGTGDVEYTDWDALGAALDDWTAGLAPA
jgi:menaquinone-dependent protoporphyrinogen oxidase